MSKIYIVGALVRGKQKDVLIEDGRIVRIGKIRASQTKGARVIDADGLTLLPAFVDMHVHRSEEHTSELQSPS